MKADAFDDGCFQPGFPAYTSGVNSRHTHSSQNGLDMSSINSSSATPTKTLRWIITALLAVLLISSMSGVFGPALIFVSLGFFVVAIVALVRGRMPMFNISNRQGGVAVLFAALYLFLIGAFTLTQTEGPMATAVAAGDECEIVGTVHEQETATYYCTPEDDNLVWASAAEFKAYQDGEAQKQAEETEAQVKAATEEAEEQLAAAEERAETAETELKDYKKEVAAEEKAREEEEVAATEAEEQRQQERQQRQSAQPAPAPAPTQAPEPAPEPQTNNSNTYYKNCTAAREAGAAPVHRGDPGYGRHLDRDGDGVGCE